ncbi:MAG: hypothetical protein A2033_14685 [Bacteroidetes bacterium GWA2_31_9]|nr:MAG: hypothetical protein A2033_14685 [Bacteroidetes bacterium GWA2_31_9]
MFKDDTSQTLNVLSADALTSNFPFGLNATDFTVSECPLNVFIFMPFWISQILIELSLPPLARYFPSGLKCTVYTASV